LRFLSVSSLVFQKTALGKASSVTVRLAVASVLLLFVGAVEITLTERYLEGSNIKNIGDGLWWAATTVTTVGYGDRYPISVSGKFIAIGLMLVGIALIGAITATFAAWFVRMVQDENKNI
jgi:voltage-gated potassium channel